MKNKDFDNIDKLAQDAFEHFEVPLNSGDWMAFQQQLDNESTIDSVAKEALAGYEVPLDPHGWEEFEQLQQHKKETAFYIWWYKAAEIGVMSLFLLGTLLNLPCSKKSTNSNSLAYGSTTTLNSSTLIHPTEANQVVTSTVLSASNLVDNSSKASKDVIAVEQDATSYKNASKDVLETTSSNPTGKELTTTGNKNAFASTQQSSTSSSVAFFTTNKAATGTTTVGTTQAVQQIPVLVDNNKTAAINNTVALTAQQYNKDQTADNNKIVAVGSFELEQLAAIDGQNLQLTPPANQEHTIEPITIMGATELKTPHICRHYLGAVLGVGANMSNSMGKTSIGYAGGFTYEKEFSSRIALSVGLLSSYKRYDRTDFIQLDRRQIDGKLYKMTQTKSSNLVLVEIPLDVNYTFFRSDKWRIYATAGLSANAIFSRTYTGSQEVQVEGLSISTDLNSNDFERGLAEGGEALQNIYISIGGGVGVERKLGDDLSLYLLPTYRHGVNTVHSDLIHTFNVNIGIKKAF